MCSLIRVKPIVRPPVTPVYRPAQLFTTTTAYPLLTKDGASPSTPLLAEEGAGGGESACL
ncbi:hypothetical protein SBA3_4440002 [Candidatus Sulfopaludibacter sp. SbA3]|nr:hypothetical protein SBA3_4440002 [Candidatus Sulfopaludibacter sp. SbA3]